MKNISHVFAFDNEWTKEGKHICLTLANSDKLYLVYTGNKGLKDSVIKAATEKHGGVFLKKGSNQTPIETFVHHLIKTEHVTGILLPYFFSPLDIVHAFGMTEAIRLFLDKSSKQVRRVHIPDTKVLGIPVRATDTCGWLKGSLETTVRSIGIDPGPKNSIKDKSDMLNAFKENPEQCVIYSLNDAKITYEYATRFPQMVENLLETTFGINIGEIPKTTGSLVAKAFETWLVKVVSNNGEFEKASRLLKVPTPKDRLKYPDWLKLEQDDKIKHWDSTPFSSAKISVLGKLPEEGCFSSVVIGGRCNNEAPYNMVIKNAADIDMSGCYGSALKRFDYPVGLCSLYSNPNNANDITLGAFLDTYGEELVDNLWQITVKTKTPLSFSQDLIYSKVVTESQIRTAVGSEFQSPDSAPNEEYEEEDFKHIPGHTVLIEQEMYSAVITSHSLKLIKAIASSKEKSELYDKLVVMSAVYYPKSLECENVGDWCNKVMAKPGGFTVVKNHTGNIIDTRSRLWFRVPIKGFIEPLLDKRKVEKALVKTDPANKDYHNGMQNLYKLFINTLYGDYASTYFEISNAVLANNITSAARCGVFLISKALGLVQTITDGGAYVPANVSLSPWTNSGRHLAGFNTLALLNKPKSKQNCYLIQRGSLDNIDWTEQFQKFADMTPDNVGTFLDSKALPHINNFWAHYGIQLDYGIEHKGSNTSKVFTYMCKAHYKVSSVWGETCYKIRGKDSDIRKDNPIKRIMNNIEAGLDNLETDMVDTVRKMFRIGQFKDECKTVYKDNGEIETYIFERLPGEYIEMITHQRFNNTHFPIKLIEEVKPRYERRTFIRHKRVQLFEQYLSQGADTFINKQANNCL